MSPHDTRVANATPDMVRAWWESGEVLLVDVREPHEYAFERIHGALLYPMSTFDPKALPLEGRRLVLHCASGKRSAMAAHRLVAAARASRGRSFRAMGPMSRPRVRLRGGRSHRPTQASIGWCQASPRAMCGRGKSR